MSTETTPEERARTITEHWHIYAEDMMGNNSAEASIAAAIRDAEQSAYVRGFKAAEKTMVPRAVGDEREACMLIADKVHDGCVETDYDRSDAWREAAFEISEAIRKRGDL